MLLMLAGVVLVAACSSDDTYLPALLADPMADYSNPSLEVESRVEIPEGKQPLSGAQDATILTGYLLTGSEESVVSDILSAAEAASWILDPDSPVIEGENATWSASKMLPEGLASMTISSRPRSSTRPYDIGISLTIDGGNQ